MSISSSNLFIWQFISSFSSSSTGNTRNDVEEGCILLNDFKNNGVLMTIGFTYGTLCKNQEKLRVCLVMSS